MQKAKVISSKDFSSLSQLLNPYLAKGYRILPIDCGTDGYQALLVTDEKPPRGLYTLTASKENISKMLFAMCDGCRYGCNADCDSCIFAYRTGDRVRFRGDCPSPDEDRLPNATLLFAWAVASGLVKEVDA